MVIAKREVEAFAFGHDIDSEDSVSEEHVVPFDVMVDDISGSGIFVEAGPLVAQVPSL